jgi:hypothetical protein
MTQDERREYLIQYLLKEEIRFGRQNIPTDKQGQENLLRSLMNVRPPRPISNDFLKIQDEYLTERNIERGILHSCAVLCASQVCANTNLACEKSYFLH